MGITGGPYNCPETLSPDPNLVGWWTFDKITGIWAVDSTGRGQHANLVNGPTPVPGRLGTALSFDGVDDYVSLPVGGLIDTLTDSTFGTWVNFRSAAGSWQHIFDFGANTTVYMFLSPNDAKTSGPLRFAITTTSGAGQYMVGDKSTLATGWHHVAVVFSMGTITLYLDGMSVASVRSPLTPSSLGFTINNWLGRSQWSADAYLSAQLDDFRIYDKALSTQELAQVMQGNTRTGFK